MAGTKPLDLIAGGSWRALARAELEAIAADIEAIVEDRRER